MIQFLQQKNRRGKTQEEKEELKWDLEDILTNYKMWTLFELWYEEINWDY